MGILFFISFIVVFISCLTIIRFNKRQNLVNSYIISLMLFFYVMLIRFINFYALKEYNISHSSDGVNSINFFVSFLLISILFFSYVLGFFIAYLIKKETRTFVFVLMFSMLAVPLSIFYFNIIYFIPFLIIFDFLIRKTYEYYKKDNKKSTLQ